MSKALRTALVYSFTIIAMLVTVNLLTSPGFLWFVFPVFGVAWWPLSVYFHGRKQPFLYAACGTALIAGLFVAAYLLASPGAHPWYLYPILGVVWWPVSVYFSGKKQPLAYALSGFALISALAITIYLAASPGAHPWFLYPMLGAFWWPLSVWGAKKGARAFSAAGGLYVILTLFAVNLVTSPAFWWWVYPSFFVLWWPAAVLMGEKAKTLSFAIGSAAAAFLFAVVMHRIHTPNAEPWYLYALLPFFWWPVCKILTPRVDRLRLALISLIVFAAYYAGLTALLHGVSTLLFVFLLFAGVWLLYAMGISKHRDSFIFAGVNAVLLAAYFFLLHRLITPDVHPWFWYAFFPLVWWPVTAALKEKAAMPLPVTACAASLLAYYGALNCLISPEIPWILFLTFPTVGGVIGSFCRERRAYVWLSVWMTLAGIAWFTTINLVFTPHALWAVYPAFALLWWPLSMALYARRPKQDEED